MLAIKVLSRGGGTLPLDRDDRFRYNGQDANRGGGGGSRAFANREARGEASSRFECEHASAKVFALNCNRSRGIYV